MYPTIKFSGILALAYLVSLSHPHCMKGIKNLVTNKDKQLYIRGAHGPNRPVMISFGPLPPKPVLSTIALTDVPPPTYQTNNQNQVGSFQVTVISSTPIQKISYDRQQNLPPMLAPAPAPVAAPTAGTPFLPQTMPNGNDNDANLSQSGKIPPGRGNTGISGIGITDDPAQNGNSLETDASLENDKGLGHSSIMTYNIGSFQGLKIVSNNKISNQNNGVNNSPGSNLDNITVNNNNKIRNDSINGIKGPDGGSSKSSQFQNNGLNLSGTSQIEGFVVNNNS